MDQDGVIRKVLSMKHPFDLSCANAHTSGSSDEHDFSTLTAMAADALSCQFHGNFVTCQ
jgi:hypothetical protein